MQNITIEMVLQLLGEKTVEVRVLGAQLQAAQAKLAEFEAKIAKKKKPEAPQVP